MSTYLAWKRLMKQCRTDTTPLCNCGDAFQADCSKYGCSGATYIAKDKVAEKILNNQPGNDK